MRKIIIGLILIIGLCSFIKLSVFQPAKEAIEEELIGSWVSNDDALWKITFDNNNIRKDYYEGILTNTYGYLVTETCGTETLTNGQFYLKTIDNEENDFSCWILEAVNNENSGILSITSERGQLDLFTKQ